jgi:hypothetical protein
MAVEADKLLVSIAADTANLRTGLAGADASLQKFAKSADAIAGKIQGIFAASAVGALTALASQALQAGAAIGRLADQAGLGTDAFQEIQFALRRTGVEGEQLAQAFATFGRNLSDLQRGTGPLLDFLRRAAPGMVEQFKRTSDVSAAFDLLASTLSRITDSQESVAPRTSRRRGANGEAGDRSRAARAAIRRASQSGSADRPRAQR